MEENHDQQTHAMKTVLTKYALENLRPRASLYSFQGDQT